MASAVKAFLVLVTAISFSVFATPPNGLPKSPPKPRLTRKTIFTSEVREWIVLCYAIYVLPIMRKLYWLASLNEVVHILRTDSGHIDPLLIIGIILAVFGTAFRYASYRYLAEAFTFELVNAGVRAKDPAGSARLVVDGPYSIVRHPSYTGWFIGTFGFIMVPFVEGSWIQTQAQGLVKVLAYTWVFIFIMSFIVTVVPRLAEEDEMMKKQFGEEWERWAHRVRYRLIPFIY